MSFGMRDLARQFSPQNCQGQTGCPNPTCQGHSCDGASREENCTTTDTRPKHAPDAAFDLTSLRQQLRRHLSRPGI